jgi:hypothetical protein
MELSEDISYVKCTLGSSRNIKIGETRGQRRYNSLQLAKGEAKPSLMLPVEL